MTTRLYIAGPMTGLPDSNYPAFNRAEGQLIGWGYQTANPVRGHLEEGAPYDYVDATTPWHAYMRNGIHQLIRCDGIALLPGWIHSRGAQLEVHIAQRLGLDVRDLAEWIRAGVAQAIDAGKEISGGQLADDDIVHIEPTA